MIIKGIIRHGILVRHSQSIYCMNHSYHSGSRFISSNLILTSDYLSNTLGIHGLHVHPKLEGWGCIYQAKVCWKTATPSQPTPSQPTPSTYPWKGMVAADTRRIITSVCWLLFRIHDSLNSTTSVFLRDHIKSHFLHIMTFLLL